MEAKEESEFESERRRGCEGERFLTSDHKPGSSSSVKNDETKIAESVREKLLTTSAEFFQLKKTGFGFSETEKRYEEFSVTDRIGTTVDGIDKSEFKKSDLAEDLKSFEFDNRIGFKSINENTRDESSIWLTKSSESFKEIHESGAIERKYLSKNRTTDDECLRTGSNEKLDQGSKTKEKKSSASSIRAVLEKRVEKVERMLEDHVERVLEDQFEKHPWLHPIETWLNEKCKSPSPSPSPTSNVFNGDVNPDTDCRGKSNPSSPKAGDGGDFKKTNDNNRDQKIERTIIEHLKNLRAKHEKIRKMQEVSCVRKKEGLANTKEINSDNPVLDRKVFDGFRGTGSGGSSPVPPKRKIFKDPNRTEPLNPDPSDPLDKTSVNKNPSFLYLNSKEHPHLLTSSPVSTEDSKIPASDKFTKRSVTPPPNFNGKLSTDSQEVTETIKQHHQHHHSQDFLDKIKEGFKEKKEELHRYFQRNTRLVDVNRKLKSQIWSSVVTIVLVEAKNLLPMDIEGLSDPYVKFRLGSEKYKSKVVHKTLSPVWLEQFDLHLYEDVGFGQELEVTVWDRDKSRDDLMGRAVINLATLEREKTHRIWRDLEDNAGSVFLLLTISGTTASETISDLAAHEETPQEKALLLQRYSIVKTLQRPQDVGHLTVKVFRAQGLAAADLGGKSDPFCVLELVNARLQTQTEYKTLAPNWQKIFTFNVKDINSVLEVTVYDEDRDHKVEFLGKIAIPLLRIRNGEKRWYALKDKKLRGRAKGNSPQILLEMTVVWNQIRACVRTLNPKERKYMEPEVKFKRQVFLNNVLRLKAIIVFFIDISKYVQSCFEWESTPRSVVAFALFIFLCYYFEPYMIPTAALLIFLKYYIVALVTGWPAYHHSSNSLSPNDPHNDIGADDAPSTPGAFDDDDDDDDKDKEEKKSLKERLQAIQEVTQTVQNSIGYIASLGESIKNTFNFTVPYLSYLAMILALLGVIVLYFVPVRYLIMAWGVNKFFRKILRPHTVPNNELLDLLSRVPDDEDLISYRELKPVPTPDCERSGLSNPGVSGSGGGRKDQRRKKTA